MRNKHVDNINGCENLPYWTGQGYNWYKTYFPVI
jgi:hypothetical protein